MFLDVTRSSEQTGEVEIRDSPHFSKLEITDPDEAKQLEQDFQNISSMRCSLGTDDTADNNLCPCRPPYTREYRYTQ